MVVLGNSCGAGLPANGSVELPAAEFEILFPAQGAGSNELMKQLSSRLPIELGNVFIQHGQPGSQLLREQAVQFGIDGNSRALN